MFAGVQASDVTNMAHVTDGFLSKHMGSDASATSVGDYNKFAMHRFNHMTHAGAPDALSHHNGLAEHGLAIYDSRQGVAGISASTVFDKQAHAALAQELKA